MYFLIFKQIDLHDMFSAMDNFSLLMGHLTWIYSRTITQSIDEKKGVGDGNPAKEGHQSLKLGTI